MALFPLVVDRAARTNARNDLATPPRRPIEPLFEPVVAPEHLAVLGDKAGCADNANLGRASALRLQQGLVRVASGALERCPGSAPHAASNAASVARSAIGNPWPN